MKRRIPLPLVAIAIAALGVLSILVSAGALWWTWTKTLDKGVGITVPASLDLDVEPGEEIVLWRELVGPHNTFNQPVVDPPPDLAVTATDRRTGLAIPTRPLSWNVAQRALPGFERRRSAVLAFDAPSHGEITLTVAGSFRHPQVYRVAPSVSAWVSEAFPVFKAGVFAGLLVIVVAIGLLVFHALRQERAPLRLDDQPFA